MVLRRHDIGSFAELEKRIAEWEQTMAGPSAGTS